MVHILKALGTPEENEQFDKIRLLRNDSAHGTKMSLTKTEFDEGFDKIGHIVSSLFDTEVLFRVLCTSYGQHFRLIGMEGVSWYE